MNLAISIMMNDYLNELDFFTIKIFIKISRNNDMPMSKKGDVCKVCYTIMNERDIGIQLFRNMTNREKRIHVTNDIHQVFKMQNQNNDDLVTFEKWKKDIEDLKNIIYSMV